MVKTFAYAGKILRVNLSTGRVKIEDTMKYARRFLGGKGINQWLMYNEVRPGIQPLDPANRIFFGVGPLAGTLAPTSGRYSVDSKNALTGGVGSANSGGFFGPELKFAGYDHIAIHGRSRKLCFLWINDEKVELMEANNLHGATTWETDKAIKEELGDKDIQIACIGPAGENQVKAACIINNGGRAAGRCGLGAVMGSKNLKAIAVRGSGQVDVAKPEEFMSIVERIWEKMTKRANIELEPLGRRSSDSSLGITARRNQYSGNQVRNFQDGFWDPEKIQRTSLKEQIKYQVRRLACFACPVPSSGYLRISKGQFKDVEGEGFYTNTLRNFGCKLDIDSLEAIIQAHMLCSQYGLDVDNTVGPIAWAMECYQRKILSEENTGGLRLKWGNYKVVLELIKKIAFREGFGDLLAEGCKRASEKIGKGSERYCMHIKGQDLYEHLRTTIGWALGVIVSPRGGGHLDGAFTLEDTGISPEMSESSYGVRTAGDRKAYDGKAKLVVHFENLNAVIDSLGLCKFPTTMRVPYPPYDITLEDLTELFSAATGIGITKAELLRVGERICNVEKAFNVREGMTRKDDYPPDRFFEPIKSGSGKGECLDRLKYDKMLNEYYVFRGWGSETGVPSKQKLKELGLTKVAEELEKIS